MAKKEVSYQEESENNEKIFREILKRGRPDLYVFMDLLDGSSVNIAVIFKVMRHLSNIATGSKYGKVTIEVDNGVATFVRGEESDRVQEPVILKKTYTYG